MGQVGSNWYTVKFSAFYMVLKIQAQTLMLAQQALHGVTSPAPTVLIGTVELTLGIPLSFHRPHISSYIRFLLHSSTKSIFSNVAL